MLETIKECHDYGSVGGCDNECPALWKGKCKVIGEVYDNVVFDDQEMDELKKIYKVKP